jgi:hypothetical protein
MVAEQCRIKASRIDIRNTLETRLVPLFKNQIVTSRGGIVLIGEQALFNVFGIMG